MQARANLATLVEDMERLGQQTAVVHHRGVRRYATSYGELAAQARGFAGALAERGIGPGERVVLWGANSAAWIACFFGCVLRGVLVVPLDAAGSGEFAQRVIEETAPRLIVGDTLLVRALPAGLAPSESLDALPASQRRAAPVELTDETPLQILFTSGTTGDPKGIVHTHGNLLASLTPIEREIEKYRRYERWFHPLGLLHTLPLSHVFGQFMGVWVAPVLGMVVHYEQRLEAPRLLRLLRRERISVLAAVPRLVGLLHDALLAEFPALAGELQRELAAPPVSAGKAIARRWWRFRGVHGRLGWRFWAIVCGGATLPAELESFWTTLGTALVQGYGMTETSALVTLNHPFRPARGTLGAPLPGRELRITNAGELQVRGAMVARGRWQGGRVVEDAGDQGWLPTGDLAQPDPQGHLRFLGRTGQRLVTAAGLNVYLEDVEAALAVQPGIVAAAVVAFEGSQGPEPVAVLRATDAKEAARAVAAANRLLLPHQRVTRWWLWPGLDLPRTTTGKLRRGVLESWVREQAGGAGQPPAADARPDPLRALLAGVGVTLPAGAEEDSSLESLGVDSLARVQLAGTLAESTGRAVVDGDLAEVRTLGQLRAWAGLPRPGGTAEKCSTWNTVENSARSGTATLPTAEAFRPAPLSTIPGRPFAPAGAFRYPRWPWSTPVRWLRAAFLEGCVRPLVFLLARPAVVGSFPQAGPQPLLLVANHVSTYDVPLLLYALPRAYRRNLAIAMSGEMLERFRQGRGNPLGPLVYLLLTGLFNVFPLPQGSDFRRAFAHAGEALDRGMSVLVFPEGRRSQGGPMQAFRGGIGLLVGEADVPVLPFGLVERRTCRGLRLFSASVACGSLLAFTPERDARARTADLEAAVREQVGRAEAAI